MTFRPTLPHRFLLSDTKQNKKLAIIMRLLKKKKKKKKGQKNEGKDLCKFYVILCFRIK